MNSIKNSALEEDQSSNEQYLLFLAGKVLYAIEALKAQEIVEYSTLTKVPMMNSFVKGVTNIRGNIVPVIDLIDRFNLGTTKIGDKTSIVVTNYRIEDTDVQIGFIIDEVHEVDKIATTDIRKAPEFGAKIDSRFILHMGKYNNEYLAILNTDAILNIDELSQLASRK